MAALCPPLFKMESGGFLLVYTIPEINASYYGMAAVIGVSAAPTMAFILKTAPCNIAGSDQVIVPMEQGCLWMRMDKDIL